MSLEKKLSVKDTKVDYHYVTIGEIVEEYDSQLAIFMKHHKTKNVVITMQVDMVVGNAPSKTYGAAVAVSHGLDDPEEVMVQLKPVFTKKAPFAFGWIPAHLYGSDDFGIFIEPGQLGEKLANGMVDEIIAAAHIEEAVTTSL